MVDRIPATGPLAQGYAQPATQEDIERDAEGITYPNLHRRIDPELDLSPITPTGDIYYLVTSNGNSIVTEDGDRILVDGLRTNPDNAEYILLVAGVNSFRYTKHDRQDEDAEIP